jgi:dihydrofolate synthase/folylpolyglutamate synthase
MNYKETLDYLYSQLPMFHRIGAAAYKADLTNTVAVCDLLGNPEKKFKSIHVAGTNGKGSSSHMLASILQQAGYKTGLYTSPHLKDFRERVKINGKEISKKYVQNFVAKYRDDFEKIQPSFFEWTVGLAFSYFTEKKVDIAIIEVGLGGRLDSTNVINPLASLITNISYDHANLLGDTLEKIAGEKAGIIKPGVPVVISQTQNNVKKVFTQKAKECGSRIIFADRNYGHTKAVYDPSKNLTTHSFHHGNKKLSVSCDLPGTYQQYNLAGVLQCIEMIREEFPVKEKTLLKALREVKKTTGLHGRWEQISKKPRVICDTGHNTDGIRQVLQCVEREYKTRLVKGQLHVVFGAVSDKDLSGIFSLLKKDPRFSKAAYYFCKPAIPRGMEADLLQQTAAAFGLKGNTYPFVKSALTGAKRQAKPGELIFVGGSTFTVAEAL